MYSLSAGSPRPVATTARGTRLRRSVCDPTRRPSAASTRASQNTVVLIAIYVSLQSSSVRRDKGPARHGRPAFQSEEGARPPPSIVAARKIPRAVSALLSFPREKPRPTESEETDGRERERVTRTVRGQKQSVTFRRILHADVFVRRDLRVENAVVRFRAAAVKFSTTLRAKPSREKNMSVQSAHILRNWPVPFSYCTRSRCSMPVLVVDPE